jgi:hypothetical protein
MQQAFLESVSWKVFEQSTLHIACTVLITTIHPSIFGFGTRLSSFEISVILLEIYSHIRILAFRITKCEKC